ncbi:hypothetical protein BDF14DRAFT_1745233 [Spinellus fusiger]|nr:hypothetical protein BDF14DRAFT_1745233 [Spinellus fusiger]
MCRGGFDCRPYDKMIYKSIPHQQLCAIACWGLSRLVENVQGSDAFFHTAILPHWLCHHFTDLLSQATHTASFPALSIVSGFIAGSVDSTLALLKENITLPLYRLVTSQPLDAFHDPALKALRRIVEHKDPRIHQLLGPDVVDTALVFIGVPRHVYSEQTPVYAAPPPSSATGH